MTRRHALPIAVSLLLSSGHLFPQEPPERKQEQKQEPKRELKQEPDFDPYHAEKSVEIGEFYLKKGNYDAAIDRFQDAVRYKPRFAKPYLLMGEAYEKKGDKAEAVKAYRNYLDILPAGEDAAKARKRIEKLSRDLARDKRRPSG
ncbi:MAG TPA: tetratricopeptide repeat protein [Candidatus Acidoferrales bacterium]|nr:tetratricopeptide repeat protein [Candidatus Acidoferrales bacterium]